MRFKNRHDAGRRMARALEAVVRPPAIVYALPRGGVPVAPRFRALCDEFIAVQFPEPFAGAVGAYYEDFAQVTDGDVLRELARAQTVPRPDLHHAQV